MIPKINIYRIKLVLTNPKKNNKKKKKINEKYLLLCYKLLLHLFFSFIINKQPDHKDRIVYKFTN
jgi:hypothetical protein